MNAFKIVALILICVLLVPLMCTLLTGVSLRCSVLSPIFADSVINKSINEKSIRTVASKPGAMPDALGEMLQSKDGAAWAQSELPKLASGSFRYFTSDHKKLPVVNIKQLKTALVDSYVDKALSKSGGDAASAKTLVKSQLGINTMKDTLDLNALTQNVYGSVENPVSGFGAMLSGVTSNLFLLNIALVVLLMALAGVIAFRSEIFCRWVGGVFTVSGSICLIPSAAGLIFNQSLTDSLSAGLPFISDWIRSFLIGASLFLLVGAVIVLVAGIVLLKASKRTGRGSHSSRRKSNVHSGARIVAVALIVAAIPASLYFFGKTVYQTTDKYNTIVMKADRSEEKMSVGRALDKTLNSRLFGTVLK